MSIVGWGVREIRKKEVAEEIVGVRLGCETPSASVLFLLIQVAPTNPSLFSEVFSFLLREVILQGRVMRGTERSSLQNRAPL